MFKMNFSWAIKSNQISNNQIDVRLNYRRITEEFCKYYYFLYDTNFFQLNGLYLPDSYFTYLDEEFVGFNSLYEKIRQNNIYKFTHHKMNITSQPVGEKTLLIMTTGCLTINDSIFQQKFAETILLQRDDNNNFFVNRTIFRLIE